MDVARFEVLETGVTNLIEAFKRTQAENTRLGQHAQQLEKTVSAQQQQLEHLQRERDDLVQLSSKIQKLTEEREIIQQKLLQMLATIEWLEERTRVDDDIEA